MRKGLIPFLTFLILLAVNARGIVDAEIIHVDVVGKYVKGLDEIVEVSVWIKNVGNETFNFPVGLSFGYRWREDILGFEGESCDVDCYADGLGDYVYTGDLAPDEYTYVTRRFKFRSDRFYNYKKYDLVTQVFNETYLPPERALDRVYWKNVIYTTPVVYPYSDEVTCYSGWGSWGDFKSCLTSKLTVPNPCPDKYVVMTTYVAYDPYVEGYTNRYGYWDGGINVTWVFPSDNLFFIATEDITPYQPDGSQFDVYVWSQPHQMTVVFGAGTVYCNIYPNISIDPEYLSWSMDYEERRTYMFRIENTGNIELDVEISASDFRWMCIKDESGTWHTSSFWITLPPGDSYDIAVLWAPAGGNIYPGCDLIGLPEEELGSIETQVIANAPDYNVRAISTQDIYVTPLVANITIEPEYLEWNMTYVERRTYMFRIQNVGTKDLTLDVLASDFRWMCIKDQEGIYHSTPFQITIPEGGVYDIAVIWAPQGGSVAPGCNLTGLPPEEVNRTVNTSITVRDEAFGIARQSIFVGPACECTSWEAAECINTTHRKLVRECFPEGCAPEVMYGEDPTCAVGVPVANITKPFVWVNITEVQEAGYSWILPFLTPLFWILIFMSGISLFVDSLFKSRGRGFLIMMIVMGLFLMYYGVLPKEVGVLIIVASGLILWYMFTRMGGG